MNSSYSQKLAMFWHNAMNKASGNKLRVKDLSLPLARIKRLMKVEEDVRMVASEVPVLFSLVAEVFVEELTLRSWINTDEGKRRILQKSDISAAIKTSQMYDFLIYVAPPTEYGSVEPSHSTELQSQAVFMDSSIHKNMNYSNF